MLPSISYKLDERIWLYLSSLPVYLQLYINIVKRKHMLTLKLFNSQYFISNSAYCLPYNLSDFSLENLELD